MTKDEKVQFVLDLTQSVAKQILQRVDSGKIPEGWNGHFMREYVVDCFREQKTDYMKRNKSEKKKYVNDISINDL
jgi:hypothetical protein